MTQDELYHYGVLGMKWGKRKAVPSMYSIRKKTIKNDYKSAKLKAYKSFQNDLNKLNKQGKGNDTNAVVKISEKYDNDIKNAKAKYKSDKKAFKETNEYKEMQKTRAKKAAIVGAAAAGTALAAYGAYKISKVIKSKQYNRGLEVYKELSSRENSRLYEQAKNSLAYKTQNNLTGRGMTGGQYGRFDYNRNADGSTSMRYVANKLPSANELRELGKKGINKYRRK